MGFGKRFHKKGNLDFKIYLEKNHKRPHLHVFSPDGEVSLSLDTLEILAVSGFSQKSVNAIVQYIIDNDLTSDALEIWEELNE